MYKVKGFVLALVILVLSVAMLSSGMADEIKTLPESWEELCALLPDMPDLEIENVKVRFPHESDGEAGVTFFCDADDWQAASGTAVFTYSFLFNEEIGAYEMDEMSKQKLDMAYKTGNATGYFGLAKTDGDWKINLVFYFDHEAFSDILYAQEPFTCSWDNVTDFSTSNYLMPNVVAQRNIENGSIQIWQYATHTIVLLRDKDGNETARGEYPVSSQFCADFMPVNPFE